MRLNSVFPQPLSLIQNDFPSLFESEPVRLIDSMPIMLAKPQRGGSAEIVGKGYDSKKKRIITASSRILPPSGETDSRLRPII